MIITRIYENILIVLTKAKAIYDFALIFLSPILLINNYIMMNQIKKLSRH
jgi:uncharacterized protein YejL (UPF0352 family)